MLTLEERRENALKHFTSTYGPDRGVKRWEDYCRKMGWLEAEDPKPKKKASSSGTPSSGAGRAGK